MMLIIADRDPYKNAKYIAEHTNKNFLFKSLLELGQLVCSAGISSVYKPVKRAYEIQDWILKNKLWVYRYYRSLWYYCMSKINMKSKTALDLYNIENDLFDSIEKKKRIVYPKTCIFRYKKGYNSKYESNSELPLEEGIKEYRKYIEEYKFPQVHSV